MLSLAVDELIPARCERVEMARLEAPVGATNFLIEPSQNYSRDGVFITRALVRAKPRLQVRIINVINQSQVLGKGTAIGHAESAVLSASIEDQEPEPRQNKHISKQLK
jgi:hypothetical protein